MNILIFSWRGPGHPESGGAEISTHEHSKGWVSAGHTVTLFTSWYKGLKRQEVIDGVNIIRSGNQNLGVHIHVFIWYCFRNHPKFDLVVDQFHGIPFFTPFYVRTKKLGFIHEVAKEVWKLNQYVFPFNFIIAILGKLLEPLIFKIYKKVPFVTVSKSSKEELVEWGIPRENITVIHSGIKNSPLKKLPPKEKIKTLIYLGALTKDKGIEEALQCFSKLSRVSREWQFWVVGKVNTKYLMKLINFGKQLGIDKKIKFWGFVDEEKKFELLAKAHIAINPSIREGWGLVVIEAARVGTPTIAANVPGLRDSIINGQTGILSDKLNGTSLATEVIKLFGDQEKYRQICKNAILWSKKFSWDKSTTMSLKLIEKVAG